MIAFTPARADVVVLKNGNEIQGEVLHDDGNFVTLKFPGGTLRLERRRIDKIVRQDRATYLVEQAEKSLRHENFTGALETLEAAQLEAPDSLRIAKVEVEARRSYGRHLVEKSRFDEAIAVFEGVLATIDDRDAQKSTRTELEMALELRDQARSEVARARAELARGDHETSLARLGRLYDAYPDFREDIRGDLAEVATRQGFALAGARRWKEAAEHFHRAATVAPESAHRVRVPFVKCQLHRIAPLAAEGRFQDVEPIARFGLELAPENVPLNYFLALALEATGEEDTARDMYVELLGEREIASNATVADLRAAVRTYVIDRSDSKSWFPQETANEVMPGDFRELRGKMFTVRHRNEAIGREVLRVAEASYRDLFRRFGGKTHWRNPCVITIHPSREDYLESTSLGAWSGAAHSIGNARARVFSQHRISTFQGQSGLTSGVVQHEIAHALLVHCLNYPKYVPLWANEGLAVSEGPEYIKHYYRRLLRAEKRRGALLPIQTILEAESYPDDDQVDLFYAQSWSLTEFLLRRRNLTTFIEFLRDLGPKGMPLGKALARHFRIPSETALGNRWYGSVED